MNRAALCSLLLLAVSIPAQGRGQRQAPAAPDLQHSDGPRRGIETEGNGFALPAGEVPLTDLIDAAARFLGRNILWTAQELQSTGNGELTFYLHKKTVLDAVGCEELLYGMLYTKGLTVLPVDEQHGFFEIVCINGPRSRDLYTRAPLRSAEQVLRRPTFREFCTVVVPLEHANANTVINYLRQCFSTPTFNGPNGPLLWIGCAGEVGPIMLTGFGDQVAIALRMLQKADVAPPAPVVTGPTGAMVPVSAIQNLAETVQQLAARVKELEGKLARN